MFIEKLRNIIFEKPEKGLSDPILSLDTGKNLPCKKHSVSLALFPRQYAIGYGFITATYLYDGNNIIIVRIYL